MSKGFTIIEVLIAIFIVTVGLGGLAALIHFTTFTAASADLELTAAYLAQEGVEATRQIRDSNFLNIHRSASAPGPDDWKLQNLVDTCPSKVCEIECIAGGTYPLCGSNGSDVDIRLIDQSSPPGDPLRFDSGFYTRSTGGVETPFRRTITIDDSTTDRLDVTVEVTWDTARSSGSKIVETQLYNWLPTQL